jgi:cytochrome P450
VPWLDLVFLKNPVLRLLDRFGIMNFSFPVAIFAKTRMEERLAEMASNKAAGIDEFANRRPDLLSMFLKAKTERPDFMTDQRVLTMAVSMAFAGSETTGISLAAAFYYLLKTPRCYHVLMRELDAAVESGKMQDRLSGIISWNESQALPYLDACIKEAFRMHPAAGLPLERITPPQGAEICGRYIPGGTIVGCSAWIIHRRPEIYGDDVGYYRPERWLEADRERLKEMNANMFQFGAGSRTCIGKNISLLEIYKLVPSFLRRFEVCHLAAAFSYE